MNESQQYRDYQNRGGTFPIRDWRKRRMQFEIESAAAIRWRDSHPGQMLIDAPNYERLNALERELHL